MTSRQPSFDDGLYILTPSEYISFTVQAIEHGRAVELTVSRQCDEDTDVGLSPADARALGYLLLAAAGDADAQASR